MKQLLKGEEPIGVQRPSKYKPVERRLRRVPIYPIEEESGEEGQLWLFSEDDS